MARRLVLALTVVLPWVLPPAVHADRLETPAPGARELTTLAGFAAWAQPTPDGRWAVVLRHPDGTVVRPAVDAFGAAPQLDLGARGVDADRRITLAYSRCAGASTTAGCDVKLLDVAAPSPDGRGFAPLGDQPEQTPAISTPTASEAAPTLGGARGSRLTFVRRAGARRPGLYSWRFAGRSQRLSTVLARQTRSNDSSVAYRYRSRAGFGIAVRTFSGELEEVVRSGQATEPTSLVMTRYRVGWLEGTTAFLTGRVRNSGPAPILRGARDLPADTAAVTTDGSSITAYAAADGIRSIEPRIFFTGSS